MYRNVTSVYSSTPSGNWYFFPEWTESSKEHFWNKKLFGQCNVFLNLYVYIICWISKEKKTLEQTRGNHLSVCLYSGEKKRKEREKEIKFLIKRLCILLSKRPVYLGISFLWCHTELHDNSRLNLSSLQTSTQLHLMWKITPVSAEPSSLMLFPDLWRNAIKSMMAQRLQIHT